MRKTRPIIGNSDPASLDAKSAHEWRQLAAQVTDKRREGLCSNANNALEAAIEREPQSPAAGAYLLWMADNLARDGNRTQSLFVYDKAVESITSNQSMVASIDGVGGTLLHKAQTAALANDAATAVETYRALARHAPGNPDPFFQAGLIMEGANDFKRAAEFYKEVANETASSRTDDPAELARRGLARLSVPDTAFSLTAEHVVDALESALSRRSGEQLRRLISTTHFAIGPLGGHTAFETETLLEQLCSDASAGSITVDRKLAGRGDKRYLRTSGWRGRWFTGDVVFLIRRSARGWQCTGCGIATPNELWLEHWRPATLQTNQPLPFELLAPWPDGQCFEAGGLAPYIRDQALIVIAAAAPWPIGAIAAAALTFAFSTRTCGFGVRGFYYNGSSTHDEEDAFAIDFSRYRRFVPYNNISDGTPVLAPRFGIVSYVSDGTPTGSDTASNTVEIQHGDPNDPANTDRYTSRYLHMEGPGRIIPSIWMPIYTGNRIGLMDDTGNSVIDHLHFSIHDRRIIYPNAPLGGSVRPTPMNGATLNDGDSGKCVCSTNVETFGAPEMIFPTGFAAQNWVITPVANAVGEAPPTSIQDQRWQLLLSGVVLIDMKGVSSSQWRRETVHIVPDLNGPILQAAARHGIPLPPGTSGSNYYCNFQVEQHAPFSTVSSIFNQNESVNSGFAVDVFRPHPYFTATDFFTNTARNNLFAGIEVDAAVRDSDAYLYRLGYRITLVGKIVFSPIIIE
jgi:Peptidase family M23